MEKKQHNEFSKILLKQEAVLIWIMSVAFLLLAFYCIYKGFTGSLPWLSAMIGFPWTAYGVSQAMYYRKSMAENTEGGVKFASVAKEIEEIKEYYNNNTTVDYSSDGIDYTAGTISYDTYDDNECGI